MHTGAAANHSARTSGASESPAACAMKFAGSCDPFDCDAGCPHGMLNSTSDLKRLAGSPNTVTPPVPSTVTIAIGA